MVLRRWGISQDNLVWSTTLIMKISHRKEFLLSLSANALYDFYSLIKSTFVVIKGLLCLYSKQDNTWLLGHWVAFFLLFLHPKLWSKSWQSTHFSHGIAWILICDPNLNNREPVCTKNRFTIYTSVCFCTLPRSSFY